MKTILLVEDEPLIAMAEKMTLERHGYSVTVAPTGEKALETVRSDREIDLILMDIDLGPGMSGTEAAQVILSEREIPLVFLSSHTGAAVVDTTEGITSYGYIVKNSGETVLLASIRMAFRLYEAKRSVARQMMEMAAAHERQRISDEQLTWWPALMEYVVENDLTAIAILDRDLNFLYVSRRFLTDYSVSEENVIGRHHYEVFPDIPQRWRDVHQRALRGEVVASDDDYFQRMDGSVDYTRWECRPFYDVHGAVGGIILYTEVLTRLRGLEKEYRMLFESITDAIIVVNANRTITDCNPAFTDLFGYSREEALGRTTSFLLCSEEGYRRLGEQMAARSNERSFVLEVAYRRKDGTCFTGEKRVQFLRDDTGGINGFIGIVHDATDRKQAEEAMERLVRDKEMMLQEVQHRIKNTMSTMVSLLEMQANNQPDHTGAREALQDAGGRFKSMEVLYDQLYRTDAHDQGSVAEYLENLAHRVVGLFPHASTVHLSVAIDHMTMDAKRLSALGLITTEFLTNAMKYALTGDAPGRLGVSLRRSGSTVILTVHDDGPGFPEGFHPERSRGFGMTLVSALAEQLEGMVRFEPGESSGARSVLEFPGPAHF